MDEKRLREIAAKLAKGIKTLEDLSKLTGFMNKMVIEMALNEKMAQHLDHEKHQKKRGSNTRNGYSKKTVISDDGELKLAISQDRESSFEPQLVKKHQTRIDKINHQILFLYAKGMTKREIANTFREMYDVDLSPTLISKVTDSVKEQVVEWQNRPLENLYPIVYLDCIVVKVKQDGSIVNKSVFLALAINVEGKKKLLGLWMAENEGAKFWLSVLTELKNRGVEDILIACIDGIKGFPDAINTVYPDTKIQLCIIHMVRSNLKFVSWKDYKELTKDLKMIYQAPTEEQALEALAHFEEIWDDKYPYIGQSWRRHWENLSTFFVYPQDIRKVIYTTNAIESLNSVIHHAIKKRKVFPTDDSVKKVIYLGMQQASKKWTMPIQNWKSAMN